MREYKLLKFDEKELIAKAKKEELDRIINLIKEDQANGTLGFIQYKRLLQLLEDK